VGFSLVGPAWQERLADPLTLNAVMVTGVRRWESPEAHVAGRVGLAVAAQEWSPELPAVVVARAAHARTVLDGVAGWQGGRGRRRADRHHDAAAAGRRRPARVRAGLLEDGFLVSAVPASRADEMTGPVLRVSTAAWVTDDQVDALADALPPTPRTRFRL
jgi:pyridoxal 5-phosphate dependent beta-lyase